MARSWRMCKFPNLMASSIGCADGYCSRIAGMGDRPQPNSAHLSRILLASWAIIFHDERENYPCGEAMRASQNRPSTAMARSGWLGAWERRRSNKSPRGDPGPDRTEVSKSEPASGIQEMPRSPQPREWLLGLLLAFTVVAVYQPASHAGFIWDDDLYVTQNPLLTEPDGLKRIWFSLDSLRSIFR